MELFIFTTGVCMKKTFKLMIGKLVGYNSTKHSLRRKSASNNILYQAFARSICQNINPPKDSLALSMSVPSMSCLIGCTVKIRRCSPI